MILGLTGSIGCGKSTVGKILVARGWYGFDADQVCRGLWNPPDAKVKTAIVSAFGTELFDNQGQLCREKIADAVFSDPEKMTKWLAILYPLLESKMTSAIDLCRRQKLDGVFEIPLLFENNYRRFFDKVMMVWAPENIRFERLQRFRGMQKEEILRRQSLQLDCDSKLEMADFGIINDQDEKYLISQIDAFLKMTDKLHYCIEE